MATARRGEDGYQDGYEETKAAIRAIDEGRYPPKPMRTAQCSACGREVARSSLMNASLRSGVCPDCYDRYSD